MQPDQSHAMEMSTIVEIVARQPARTAALEPAGRGRRHPFVAIFLVK